MPVNRKSLACGTSPLAAGPLLINLRAEGDAAVLAACVQKTLAALLAKQPQVALEKMQMEHFRPGQPKPPTAVASVA